jgi:hypothetical protein
MAEAPSIAITCECGASESVALGSRWRCEACGRTWDTSRIPVHEVLARTRRMRRYQLEAVVLTSLLVATFLVLVVLVDPGLILLGAAAAFAWIFFYLPFWRRRVRRALGEAPRWQLTPE